MSDYEDGLFGERFAATYDDIYQWYVPSKAQLNFIVDRFEGKTVVEAGAGTGRLAIPLAAQGVTVIALDISEKMLDVLRSKMGSLPIIPITGDASDFAVAEPVAGIIAVFNMITLFDGRQPQLRFFESAARALSPDGELIIETMVPHDDILPGTSGLRVRAASAGQVILEVGTHNRASQRCEFQYVVLRHNEPVQLLPHRMHYLWPDQLDSLASEAGFDLAERYSDWRGSPFRAESRSNISVYRLANL